jgi:multiple sugar transport system substrate-binding protein
MKRLAVLVTATAAAATLALTGCSSSGGSSGGVPGGKSSGSASGSGGGSGAPVTLSLVGADYGTTQADTTTKYWQNIATAFHKQNPSITVNVSTINWTDYDTSVKNQIQAKHYPDILQGEFFKDYASDGLTLPTSDWIDGTPGVSAFASQFSANGKQYALPFTTSTRAMFYNKKAFAAAGISTPPKTWAELESDGLKLKAKGYTGFAMPLGSEEAQAESYLWMLGNNGGWQDSSGKYDINSSQNIATFEFMKKLVSEGVTEPNPASYNRTADAAADFAAGKVGMTFNGPQLIPTIKSAGKLTSSDYATSTVPGKNGPITKTLGVADAIQVFKTTDTNKLAAIKKFMAYALNNANQIAFANEYNLLPGMQAAADTLDNDPVLGAFVKPLPNSVQYPSDANWTATVLPAVKQTIGTAVKGNPKSVLDALQAKAKQ